MNSRMYLVFNNAYLSLGVLSGDLNEGLSGKSKNETQHTFL
jgi:hypothetical protein